MLRRLAPLATALLLAFAVLPARPVLAQFFLDDFEDGDAFDGSPVKWVPEVDPFPVGDAKVDAGNLVLVPAESEFYPNYWETDWEAEAELSPDVTVRTQLRTLGAGGISYQGIYARDTHNIDAWNGEAVFVYVVSNGLLTLGKTLDGNPSTLVESTFPQLTPQSRDIHLELSLVGNVASVYAWRDGDPRPTAPLLQSPGVGGAFYTPGRVGVFSGQEDDIDFIAGAFRFVEAAQPEFDVAGAGQLGSLQVSGDFSGGKLAPAEGLQPGLLQRWFSVNNPESYDNVIANVYDPQSPGTSLEPDVPAFHSAHTWWTGTGPQVAGTAVYPAELWGQPRTQDAGEWNGIDNEHYTVALEGEIFIPEPGKYRFVDGVDDLAILGIDRNRDGVVAESELLINDNDWTSVDRSQNLGGLPTNTMPSATFSDIAPGGEWLKMQAFVAEGQLGDAGIFYWDYDATDRDGDGKKLGDAPGFPTSARGNGRTIASENLSQLLIPDTYLRSSGGQQLIAGQVDAKLAQAIYKFELGPNGTHDQLSVERPAAAVSTKLDLNDATLELLALGEPKLGEYRLVVANQLQGRAALEIPESLSLWFDTSRLLSEGLLLVVLPGDANADHKVDLSDFGILKQHFGVGTTRAQGDFNFDAKVDLTDFGILKEHFGKTGATTVPEPSGLLLAAMAVFATGAVHVQRRKTARPAPESRVRQ